MTQLAANRLPQGCLDVCRRVVPLCLADPYTPNVGAERTYSYRELAERVEEVLGDRPSLSALRASASASRRSATTQGWPRLTAGMPAPKPSKSRTAPAAFSQREVEVWLRRHPRLAATKAYDALVTATGKPRSRLEVAVRKARSAGLSWRLVAEAVTEGSGLPHSTAGVYKAFRDTGPRVR